MTGIAEGAPEAATWNTYIQVENADETALKAAKAGATIISEPFDVMEDGRMAVIADPEGAVFCIWQPKTFKGADIVNEHGSVNFNGLNTRDPEARSASTARSSAGRRSTSAPPSPRGLCPRTATTSRS